MKQLTERTACIEKLGYGISYGGLVLIFIWLGLFKFTPTEADMIKPMIENHPLTFFLYKFLSVQQVSNLFGSIEIVIGLLLLLGLRISKLQVVGAMASVFTFVITLSFMITTPGVFKSVDGFLIPDFFLLKDLLLLGFSIIILSKSLHNACGCSSCCTSESCSVN